MVLPLAYVALLQGARRALSCRKMAAAVRIGKCEKGSSRKSELGGVVSAPQPGDLDNLWHSQCHIVIVAGLILAAGESMALLR